MNEPWDSPHNIKLLPLMPKIYAPVGIKTKEPHTTFYQVFTGPNLVFEFSKIGYRMPFGDGTSNTILVIEAHEPVPWTKPADLPVDRKKPLPRVGGLFNGSFHVLFADVSVRFYQKQPEDRLMMPAITPHGGEVNPPFWYR